MTKKLFLKDNTLVLRDESEEETIYSGIIHAVLDTDGQLTIVTDDKQITVEEVYPSDEVPVNSDNFVLVEIPKKLTIMNRWKFRAYKLYTCCSTEERQDAIAHIRQIIGESFNLPDGQQAVLCFFKDDRARLVFTAPPEDIPLILLLLDNAYRRNVFISTRSFGFTLKQKHTEEEKLSEKEPNSKKRKKSDLV